MKFKTVSEFIYALEVEGKKFEHPDSDLHFVAWGGGGVMVWLKDPGNEPWDFTMWGRILTHDWQEYIPEPEPETEEVELEEWMWKGSSQYNFYYTDWIRAGHEHFAEDAFKTGVTRKVKVPK